MIVRQSQTLKPEEGLNVLEIDTGEDLELDLQIDVPCDLFIRIRKAGKIDVKASLRDSQKAAVLFWNETNDKLETVETYNVENNADLTVAYGECNDADTDRTVDVQISGSHASATVSSASLISSRKDYRISVVNSGRYTIGNIRNYAVVLKDGKLMIDAVGRINKGAKKARSHQTSRALAFEEGQSATILPELLIDENDVQASHAMSIGRVDENHLYYLMSRGLDMKQCTMLISEGYLMPITDSINDEELKKTLKAELERKIEEKCSM